jgi:prevent-host-death family protein
MTIEVSIAEAKSRLSQLLKRARHDLVIVTRRGQPEAVLLPFDEYEHLRRLHAYSRMVNLSRRLETLGLTVTELYDSSRQELEERAWS